MKPSVSLGLILLGGAGIFFTSFDLVFALFAAAGALLYVAGNLVNKSLEATQDDLAHPDAFTLSLKDTGHALVQTKYMTKVGPLGERAHAQLQLLAERRKFLLTTLGKKFSSGEITYARYLGAIEETSDLLLKNLKLLASSLASLELQESVEAKERCLSLMEFNDGALTELAKLSDALTLINAGGSTNNELEESLIEIKKLTNQSQKYSS